MTVDKFSHQLNNFNNKWRNLDHPFRNVLEELIPMTTRHSFTPGIMIVSITISTRKKV